MNESVCVYMRTKERERQKAKEKGVDEGCSESSDPHSKHSDESPDNGFSVELLEPAAADPHSTSGHARDSCSPLFIKGEGHRVGGEERRSDSMTNSKTDASHDY